MKRHVRQNICYKTDVRDRGVVQLAWVGRWSGVESIHIRRVLALVTSTLVLKREGQRVTERGKLLSSYLRVA